jgi:hypothetical protein
MASSNTLRRMAVSSEVTSKIMRLGAMGSTSFQMATHTTASGSETSLRAKASMSGKMGESTTAILKMVYDTERQSTQWTTA